MTQPENRNFSNREHFWKAFVVFLIFIAGICLSIYGIHATQNGKVLLPATPSVSEKYKILHEIESQLVKQKQTKIQTLSTLLQSTQSDRWEDVITVWLGEHEDAVSVTVYSNRLRWPVHQTDVDFWELEDVKALPWKERQQLFDSIMQAPNLSESQIEWISDSSPFDVLGYPFLRFNYSSPDTSFRLGALFRDIDLSISYRNPALQFCLLDEYGDTLFASRDYSVLSSHSDLTSESFELLSVPWQIHMVSNNSQKNIAVNSMLPFLMPGLVVVLLAILASFLLARWVGSPLNPLYSAAKQISGGDFSVRIPESKNQTVHHIGRLINYMAEEMDHIQKMNVNQIIVEKNKTETILRNIADGVLVTDNSDKVLVVNPAIEFWFDVREDSVFQIPAREVLKQERLEKLIEDVRSSQKAASIDFHMRIIEIDEDKIFHAHAAPVSSEQDHRIGVVTVIRDVTQQREIEKMKTELVSMVAHELKSPLTSIFGFSELLLKSELPDEKSEEYAQVILSESKRLADLVDKFLNLSRLESGKTEPQIQPFDIRDSVARLLETHGQLARSKNIRVMTELPGYTTKVMGDEAMIDQVLHNLYSNAIKYSPVGAKIGIELKESENTVTLNMIDNGIGIEKDDLSNIFDKFYRVKRDTETHSPEGSGLGLSLVKQIIEKHQGTVSVKSQPGVGSVFGFSIPKLKNDNKTLEG